MTSPQFDNLMVESIKHGDSDAWEAAYVAYRRPMLGFLMTQLNDFDDASEALSETYLRAIEKVASFRGDALSFRAWLYRIARNVAVDRRRARSRCLPGPTGNDSADPTQPSGEERFLLLEDSASVRKAFATLPDEYREVLWLRVCEGMTSGEVGEVLGKRPGAVRMQQLRALELLSNRISR